jgi:hypothetical protein
MKVIGDVNGEISHRQPMPGATPDHVCVPDPQSTPRGRRFRALSAKAAIQPHARSHLNVGDRLSVGTPWSEAAARAGAISIRTAASVLSDVNPKRRA